MGDTNKLEPGTPRKLFDAIGELALAIKPHNMDRSQREKIQSALHVLVDHIIAIGEARQSRPYNEEVGHGQSG